MDIMERFEKNVKLMLEEKGISQAELARRLKTGKSTITGWLKEHKEPTISNIEKLLEEFNCTFEELIN